MLLVTVIVCSSERLRPAMHVSPTAGELAPHCIVESSCRLSVSHSRQESILDAHKSSTRFRLFGFVRSQFVYRIPR